MHEQWTLEAALGGTLCICFSRMRSKGSRFTLGVWGLRVCSLDVAQPSASVRNRSREGPLATLYASFTCHTSHSTLCILHFTLYTPLATLYTPHCTLYTPHSALYTMYTLHSTLQTLHLTPDSPYSTLCTLHITFHALHYTAHFMLHTLDSTLYTVHSRLYTTHFTLPTSYFTLCTWHSSLYTLHFELYTSHSTHYTLHSTLYILHCARSVIIAQSCFAERTNRAAATGCNIMRFSSLCVSTSVPLTYVWAFGFVGCILFWMCTGVSIAKVKLSTTDLKVHSRKYAYQLTCPCQTW